MTAYAGDAMSHAQFSARARVLQPLFCVMKIENRIAAFRLPCHLKKNRSIGDRMAAMGLGDGTKDAGPFHLRITCANLAGDSDNFSHQ
jgi:hypothetical protein